MPTRFLFENAQSKTRCSGITRAAFALLLLSFAVFSVAQNVSFVDNTDPRIRYSPGWFNVIGPNQYGGSAMLARDADAAASLTFQGTGISVFGTQGTSGGNGNTTSTYAVDFISADNYLVPPDLTQVQFNIRFYQSPVLPDGVHTLVITNRNSDSFYWLDYLEITSAGFQTVPPTPTPTLGPLNPEVQVQPATPSSFSSQHFAASNSPPMSVSSTSGFTTTSGETQRAAATQANSHSTVPSGAAAGIAVSSVVLVSVGVFALWLRTRRRVKKSSDFEASNIEPFDRNSGPAGGFIQGATTPYRVEHFPGPGTPPLRAPPFLPPEKQPVITSSQPSYLLDYEHHGPGLPPGAGTPHLWVDPDMYPSFTTIAGNQRQPTPQVHSSETPTNYATQGSSINVEARRTGIPTAATGTQRESQPQQRPPAFEPRLVVLS